MHKRQTVKDAMFGFGIPSGKSGFVFRQNYDAVVKWMGEQFKGKTLSIFGLKTEPIVEAFNFEPVTIRVDTGRVDLIFRDKSGNLYHLEEQRNMTAKDLHRFGVYHFQAAAKWMNTRITDVILMSGKPYHGDKTIQTGTGTYSPVIIDLTLKDGAKRLKEIKAEIDAGNHDNLIELVFIPLYGRMKNEERGKIALEVLNYEIQLLRENRFQDKLIVATIIMVNKIIDKELLRKIYEEVKNMLDILEIAREDGMEKGMQKGMVKGRLKGRLEGKLEGKLEGRLEGKLEGRLEMAKAFKQKGIDINIIADAAGIPLKKVKRL